jgi:hypothetical protein
MPDEREQDHVARAFNESYQLVVDQTPIEDPVWPPVVSTFKVDSSPDRWVWSGWKAAAAGFLLTVAFGVGWLVAPSPGPTATDPTVIETVTVTAVAIPDDARALFSNPYDAAIAAAIAQDPSLVDAHVTRMIGIGADEQFVDFRIQVEADGFCHWYGVMGHIQDGALVWGGGPAGACDE